MWQIAGLAVPWTSRSCGEPPSKASGWLLAPACPWALGTSGFTKKPLYHIPRCFSNTAYAHLVHYHALTCHLIAVAHMQCHGVNTTGPRYVPSSDVLATCGCSDALCTATAWTVMGPCLPGKCASKYACGGRRAKYHLYLACTEAHGGTVHGGATHHL